MKNVKNARIFCLSLIFLFCFLSCTQSVSEGDADFQQKKKDELYQYIAVKGEPVTFVCQKKPSDSKVLLSYQWYEVTANGKTLIDGAAEASFTSSQMTEPGIKTYCCIVTEKLDGNTESKTIFYSAAWTGLPVLYLNTVVGTKEINQKNYTPVSFYLFNSDGEEISKIEYDETAADPACQIKGRGNSSWRAPKKGYNIKLAKKESFFELPKAKKWCIIPNYMDSSLIKNTFVSILGRKIFNEEAWNPTIINIDVVMDGEYIGNYAFAERVSLTEGRVGVQDIKDCTDKNIGKGKYVDINGDSIVDFYDGGFILEVDRWHDADLLFETKKGAEFSLKDPNDREDVTDEMLNHIKKIVQTAENAIYSKDYKNPAEPTTDPEDPDKLLPAGWRKYIDEDDLVDWFLVHEFTKSRDCNFWTSVYMYYDPADGKLHFGPNWDFDLSMTSTKPEGWKIEDCLWLSRIKEDEGFTEKLKERWEATSSDLYRAINGDFDGEDIQALADKIEISANFDRMRWNDSFYIMENFLSEEDDKEEYMAVIASLKDWCNTRWNWLNSEISKL